MEKLNMKELNTLLLNTFLFENGLALLIFIFCLIVLSYGFYHWINLKKHRIDKFNESISEVIDKINFKENSSEWETTLRVFMEEYAKIIGLKKLK